MGLPADSAQPVAEVDLLLVENVAFVEAADGVERRAPDRDRRTEHPVGRPCLPLAAAETEPAAEATLLHEERDRRRKGVRRRLVHPLAIDEPRPGHRDIGVLLEV